MVRRVSPGRMRLTNGRINLTVLFMKIPYRHPLPFPHVELSAALFEQVKQHAFHWSEKWGVVDAPQVMFACVHTKHCSPEGSDMHQLALVVEFLLWFVALNDMPDGVDRLSLLQRVRDTLAKDRPGTNASGSPLLDVTENLIREIRARYGIGPSDRVMRKLIDLVSATAEETRCAGEPLAPDAYLVQREETIGAHPYLALHRLGLCLPSITPALSERLEHLEHLAVQCIFFVNDVMHVQRDARKNKLNLVLCLAKAHQIGIDEAQTLALQMTREKLQQLDERCKQLMADEENAVVRQYASFLLSVQEGNRASTLALHDRYYGNG